MAHAAEMRSILFPVADVDVAIRYYQAGLGLPIKFVEGTRYAALLAGGIDLTLASHADAMVSGPNVCFKVADLAQAVQDLRMAGGDVLVEHQKGPHEVRAVVADPFGNPIVLYSPASRHA